MYSSGLRIFTGCLLLVSASSFLVGCKEWKVAPVKGVITLDGVPLQSASVRFQPVGGGRPSVGFTDEKGFYELDYSMREAGAEVGQCEVHIATGGGGDYDEDGNRTQAASKDQVPRKYKDNPVIVNVEPKRNVIDIALTSDD